MNYVNKVKYKDSIYITLLCICYIYFDYEFLISAYNY